MEAQGNSITQQYYRDNLLRGYYEEVKELKKRLGQAILQKDNDSSHGTRPNKRRKTLNVCEQYKLDNDIETILHPAQSPDLNPKKGTWNVFMANVRRRIPRERVTGSEKELREICDWAWEDISLRQI